MERRRRGTWKRICSVLLVAALLLSLMPGGILSVQAQETQPSAQAAEESQYSFRISFTSIPTGATELQYTVSNAQGAELTTGSVTPTDGSATVTFSTDTPIVSIRCTADRSITRELKAAGNWTCDFNLEKWSHDHTGEEPTSEVIYGEGSHELTYPCGLKETGSHSYDEATEKCVCGREKRVCRLYVLCPINYDYDRLQCYLDPYTPVDSRDTEVTWDGEWCLISYLLPRSYAKGFYLQLPSNDSVRYPAEGTLSLDPSEGIWMYTIASDGTGGTPQRHDETHHLCPSGRETCVICEQYPEPKTYKVYAVLPEAWQDVRFCGYSEDPQAHEPILSVNVPMTKTDSGYWTANISSRYQLRDAGFIHAGEPEPVRERIGDYDRSSEIYTWIFVKKDSLPYSSTFRDHTNESTAKHYYMDGKCIACGLNFVPVAQVEGQECATLEDAWDAALEAASASGEEVTITLSADVSLNETLRLSGGQKITLNGNGHTVSKSAYGGTLFVIDNGAFTLENTTIRNDSSGSCVAVFFDSSFTMNSGTLENNNTDGSCVQVFYGGQFTLGGGTLRANASSVYMSDGNFIMNGGKILPGAGQIENEGALRISGEDSNVQISGGTLEGTGFGVRVESDATVTLSGGSFTGTQGPGLKAEVNLTKTHLSGGTYSSVQVPEGSSVGNLLEEGYSYVRGSVRVEDTGTALSDVTVKDQLLVVTGGELGVDYTYENHVVTVLTDKALTIANRDPSTATADRIEVTSGISANITLSGVNINTAAAAFKIADDSTGDVTVTLAEGTTNTLISGKNCAGLQKNGTSGTLTITGTGTLNATGGDFGAGIGGGKDGSGSNIKIDGGTVKATGGMGGAGIGGGYFGNGTVTISGTADVTANGGDQAAGIGGGNFGNGTVTISGGTVKATGGGNGAGIGGGAYSSGTVTIISGTVNGTCRSGGAGIGNGSEGSGGMVEISGGTVTATSVDGAGIGNGNHGSDGCSFSTGENGHAWIVASSISGNEDTSAWSGIIFQGSDGQVYKTPALTENAEILSGKTLTVPSGAVLTIGEGVTITNSGSLRIARGGKIEGKGTITGTGTFLTEDLAAKDIVVPTGLVYNGTDRSDYIQQNTKLATKTYCGKTFTLMGWTGPKVTTTDNFQYTVTYTHTSGDTILANVTLKQSGTTLTATIKDNKTDYAYSNTIFINVTVKPSGAAAPSRLRGEPTSGQVAVYEGDTQVSEPTDLVNGICSFEIPAKNLGAGEHTLTVKFIETSAMAGATAEVTLTVAECPHPGMDASNKCTVCGQAIVATVEINGVTTYYTDFATAWNSADTAEKATVTMLIDQTISERLKMESGGTITLTMKEGVTLTSSVDYSLWVAGGGTLKLEKCKIKADKSDRTIYIQNGTAELTDCEIDGSGRWNVACIMVFPNAGQTAKAIVHSGTYIGERALFIQGFGEGTAELYGGTFKPKGSYGDSTWAIKITSGKTVGDLLAEGYGYRKSNGEWVTDLSQTSITDEVTVQRLPVEITAQPTAPAAVDYGYTVAPTMTVTAEATGSVTDITYQWYYADGTEVDGQTTNTLTVPAGLNAGNYQFYCTVTCDGYTLNSQTTTVTVHKKTLTITGATLAEKIYDSTVGATVESVTFDGVTLTLGTDYTATAVYNSADAGADKSATLTVTLTNDNYTFADGSKEATYTLNGQTIKPKPVTGEVTVSGLYEYSGTAIVPPADKVTVTYRDGDTVVTIPSSEYTFTCTDNIELGTAKLTLADKDGGNYVVSGDGTFEIIRPSLNNAEITLSENSFTYDGTEKAPIVTVVKNGITVPASEYDISYSNTNGGVGNHTNAGTVTLTVTAKTDGHYSGKNSVTFTITPAQLPEVTLSPESANYNGTEQKPVITVGSLVEGTDYELSFAPNNFTNAGAIQITVTGKGNYTGTTVRTYTIYKVVPTIEWSSTTQELVYTGEEAKFNAPNVTLVNGETFSGTILYSYEKDGVTHDGLPVDAGTYTIKARISAAGNYTAAGSTNTLSLTIKKATPTIKFADSYDPNKIYDGQAITNPTAEDLIITGAGYENVVIDWSGDPVNAGTYTLTATIPETDNTAKAEVKKEVTISSKTITAEVTVTPASTVYDGTAKQPTVTVKDGETLIGKNEYTVAYKSNINVGQATVTISDKDGGNYVVSGSATFAITPASISSAVVTVAEGSVYNGKEQKPEVTVTLGGKTLTKDTDYTLTYADNVDAGTATVTVTGKDNYTGTTVKTYTITKATPLVKWNSTSQELVYTGEKAAIIAPNVTLVNGETFDGTIIYSYEKDGEYHAGLPVDAGTYTITASIPTADNYTAAGSTNTLSLTIKKATPTIAFAGNYDPSKTYDGQKITNPTAENLIITGVGASFDKVVFAWSADPVNAGTYTLTATIPETDNTAKAEVKKEVTISPKTVTAEVTVTPASTVYDGTAKQPTVTVKDGETLIGKNEYNVKYESNINVGQATVTISDKDGGNYIVSGSATFAITRASISSAVVTVAEGSVYNGKEQKSEVTVTLDGKTLIKDTDYTLSYADNVDAGTATVTVTGKGNYTGEARGTFTIDKAVITSISATMDSVKAPKAQGRVQSVVASGSGYTAVITWEPAGSTYGFNTAYTATMTLTPDQNHVFGELSQDGWNVTVGEDGKAILSKTFSATRKEQITAVTAPADWTLKVHFPNAAAVIKGLPLPATVSVTTETGTASLPISWSCEDYNTAPNAQNSFTWAVTDVGSYDASGVTLTGTIKVTNPSALPVSITGTDKEVTYNGSTMDVSKLFTMDQNAGAASYSITGGTGEGTLSGSTLTVTKAGTFTITVQTAAKGIYAAGEASATLTVKPKTLTPQLAGTTEKIYDGTTHVPNGLYIKLDGLVEGDDVTASAVYSYDSSDAGDRTISAIGITLGGKTAGNYVLSATTATVEGTIRQAVLSITAIDQTITYGGSIAQGTEQVKINGLQGSDALDSIILTATGDQVSENNSIVPSDAVVKNGEKDVTANYRFSYQPGKLTIERLPISVPTAISLIYNGKEQIGVESGTGYTVEGNTGTNAGTYTAIATPDSNHCWKDGSTEAKEITWRIDRAKMENAQANGYTGAYDGNAHGITITGYPSGVTVRYGTENGTYNLTKNPTYTNAGTYTVYYQLTSPNYETVTGSATVTIERKAIEYPVVHTGLVYNGQNQTGVESGEGYILTNAAAKNAGTYTATATLNANYKWSNGKTEDATFDWSIGKKEITVSITANGGVYNGRPFPATAELEGVVENETVTATLTYAEKGKAAGSAVAPTDVGTYTVTATITDSNYDLTGLNSKDFTITPASIEDVKVTVDGSYTYNGTAHTPAPTVTLGNKSLTKDTDYALTYTDNVDAGTATVTVTGVGNYTGEAKETFTIDKAVITSFSATMDSVKAPEAQGRVQSVVASGSGYGAVITWEPAPSTYGFNTAYTATLTLTPDQNHVFGALSQDGWNVTVGKDGKAILSKTFSATRKEQITAVTAPADWTLKVHFPNAAAVIEGLPLPATVSVTTETGTASLPIAWSCEDYNTAPNAQNSFTWAVTDVGSYDASGVPLTGTIKVTNPNALPVSITGTDKEVTYNGSTMDVSKLFTMDQNAGAASYSITGGTGEGTLSGSVLTVTKAGTFTITVQTEAKGIYADGTADVTLTVHKGTGIGSVTIEDWTYGETAKKPVPESNTNGSGNVTYTYVLGDETVAIPKEAGTYTVTAAFGETDLYNGCTASAEFTIASKSITVTITPNGGVYGGEITGATAVLNDVVTGDTAPTVILMYTGKANDGTEVHSTDVPTKAGTYTVTASINSNNYTLTGTVTAGFQVDRAESSLTVAEVAEKTYGDADFTLEVTADAGRDIRYVSSNPAVVTVDETGKVHLVGAGEATIIVTLAEDANFLSKQLEASVKVARKPIRVLADSAEVTYGEPVQELSYTVTTEDLIGNDTLTGITVTRREGEDAGEYIVTLTQEDGANPNYNVELVAGKLTIQPKDIGNAEIVLGPVLTANGKEQTQTLESVTVKNSKGEDMEVTYTVTGNTAVNAGGHTMTITGTGNFTGTKKQSFAIAPGAGQPVETDGSGNPVLGTGKITEQVISGDGAPAVDVVTSKAEIIELLIQSGWLTAQELAQVVDGAELRIIFTISGNVSADDQSQIKALADGYTIGSWFDISLYKQLGEGDIVWLHETEKPIRLTVQVPENLMNTDKNVTRTSWVIRCHDGNAEFLPAQYDDSSKTLSFETDRFSGYAIVYKDTQNTATGTIPQTGDSSRVDLWPAMVAMSALGLGIVLNANRKKKRIS